MFSRAGRNGHANRGAAAGKKTRRLFEPFLYSKMIILPRQARDKHIGKALKRTVFDRFLQPLNMGAVDQVCIYIHSILNNERSVSFVRRNERFFDVQCDARGRLLSAGVWMRRAVAVLSCLVLSCLILSCLVWSCLVLCRWRWCSARTARCSTRRAKR